MCPPPASEDDRVQEWGSEWTSEEDELWLAGVTFTANAT